MIFGIDGWIVWLIIMLLMIILEAMTTMLISIWFVFGALAAAVAAALGATVGIQVLVFVVVSLIALGISWSLRSRFMMQKHKTPTNADRFVGSVALVTLTIDPLSGQGRVNIDGQDWSARSSQHIEIVSGTKVVVEAIEGVKMLVKPLDVDHETDGGSL